MTNFLWAVANLGSWNFDVWVSPAFLAASKSRMGELLKTQSLEAFNKAYNEYVTDTMLAKRGMGGIIGYSNSTVKFDEDGLALIQIRGDRCELGRDLTRTIDEPGGWHTSHNVDDSYQFMVLLYIFMSWARNVTTEALSLNFEDDPRSLRMGRVGLWGLENFEPNLSVQPAFCGFRVWTSPEFKLAEQTLADEISSSESLGVFGQRFTAIYKNDNEILEGVRLDSEGLARIFVRGNGSYLYREREKPHPSHLTQWGLMGSYATHNIDNPLQFGTLFKVFRTWAMNVHEKAVSLHLIEPLPLGN